MMFIAIALLNIAHFAYCAQMNSTNANSEVRSSALATDAGSEAKPVHAAIRLYGPDAKSQDFAARYGTHRRADAPLSFKLHGPDAQSTELAAKSSTHRRAAAPLSLQPDQAEIDRLNAADSAPW